MWYLDSFAVVVLGGFWGSPVWGLCSVLTDIISGHMKRK